MSINTFYPNPSASYFNFHFTLGASNSVFLPLFFKVHRKFATQLVFLRTRRNYADLSFEVRPLRLEEPEIFSGISAVADFSNCQRNLKICACYDLAHAEEFSYGVCVSFSFGPEIFASLGFVEFADRGVWPVPNLEPTREIRRLNFLNHHGSLLGVFSSDFKPAHFRPRAPVPLFNRAKRRRDENKPEFRILENFALKF